MKGLRLSDETVLVEFGKDYAIFHDDGNGFWYWQFDGVTTPKEYTAEAWEYAKNLVCAMFDDGKLDLVSEQIKGYVTAS